MHIGSQITDLAPFKDAFALLRELVGTLRAQGHHLSHLDIGGGLGVPYQGSNDIPPSPAAYAGVVRETLGDLGLPITLEPGRMIVANAGILVARVIYAKHGAAKRFSIIDAAMNDLIRPTLYDAHHEIWPIEEAVGGRPKAVQDVVGPVCETGDYLAQNRTLPELTSGDLVAFMTAGAYGAAMSSTYNTRPLVPEVLVNGPDWALIRPRQTYDDLIGQDRLPDWLAG